MRRAIETQRKDSRVRKAEWQKATNIHPTNSNMLNSHKYLQAMVIMLLLLLLLLHINIMKEYFGSYANPFSVALKRVCVFHEDSTIELDIWWSVRFAGVGKFVVILLGSKTHLKTVNGIFPAFAFDRNNGKINENGVQKNDFEFLFFSFLLTRLLVGWESFPLRLQD